MISDVLVAHDGTIWVATNSGLAWSRDKGRTWSWTRGADYNDKLNNRLGTTALKPLFTAQSSTWSEDYISCLAEDGAGMLWVGHWRKGYEVYNPKTQKFVLNGAPGNQSDDLASSGDGDYVKCILPLPNEAPLIGRYGFGLTIAPRFFDSAAASVTPKPLSSTRTTPLQTALPQTALAQTSFEPAAFPSVQQAPNLSELNALLKQLSAVPVQAPPNAPAVESLDDDWTTRGDWLGRYGRYWAELCAMFAPSDYLWGAGSEPVNYYPRIGYNVPKGDGLRTFVSSVYTDNPNSLEIPFTFLDTRIRRGYTTKERGRRQSEIDDHGEVYPYEKDGPHLYVSLQVPPGVWTLSLYDWNKDGDASENRDRDYRISIRSHNREKPLDDITDFLQQPELARARLRDFRRGTWKRFLVVGPQEMTVEVNKNYSHNTILAAVMLDELNEKPSPYFYTTEQARVIKVSQQREVEKRVAEPSSARRERLSSRTSETAAATALFNELDWMRSSNPQWWAQSSRRFYQPLTLWLQAEQKIAHDNNAPVSETKAISAQLATCYYSLHLFDNWEAQQRKAGLIPARDIEKTLTWDGVSRGNGDGYNTVVKYLAAQKQESSTRSMSTLPIAAKSNRNAR